jgi:hypothetical protein
MKKGPATGRASIDRMARPDLLPKKSGTAWKSRREDRFVVDQSTEEAKYDVSDWWTG